VLWLRLSPQGAAAQPRSAGHGLLPPPGQGHAGPGVLDGPGGGPSSSPNSIWP